MATALPVYHASVNWPRYTFVYFNDVDLSAYKYWARKHPEYFAGRPSTRRMASNVQMRISIRANGRYKEELTLNNVVKDSRSNVSLITREKATATKGELLASTNARDPRDKITLRIRRPRCAASETETFFVVDRCPGNYDAVLRHDLTLEQDAGSHPIGLGHRNKAEREEQKRRDYEARARRQAEKEAEDRRFEEAAWRRQQTQHSQQSASRPMDQRGSGAGQQQQSRHTDQRGSGTGGRHGP